MFRRQAARAQEEPIPDELIANIPVVGDEATTVFSPVESDMDDVILVTPPPAAEGPKTPEEDPVPETVTASESAGAALAAQLRYDMGEAFARELDKAENAFSAAISDIEKRLVEAEAALVRAHQAAQREREAREAAENRLKAFKELALK